MKMTSMMKTRSGIFRGAVLLLALPWMLAACGPTPISGSLRPASVCPNGQVNLLWDASKTDGVPDPRVVGYRIYVGNKSRKYSFSVEKPVEGQPAEISHTLTDIATGTYYFTVTAYSATEESPFSNEISCRVQSPEGTLAAEDAHQLTVKVNFVPPS